MDREEIERFCGEARAWVAPRWAEWRPLIHPNLTEPQPAGMCQESAVFLREVLAKRFPEATWYATGGENDLCSEDPPGGMVPKGHWRPQAHAWVEGRLRDGRRLIVDITADQFGHDGVIVTDAADERYWRTYDLREAPYPGLVSTTVGKAWAGDFIRERDGVARPGAASFTGAFLREWRRQAEERARLHSAPSAVVER